MNSNPSNNPGNQTTGSVARYEALTIEMLPLDVTSTEGVTLDYGIQFGDLPVLVAQPQHQVLPERVEVPCLLADGHTHTWVLCMPGGRHYHMA